MNYSNLPISHNFEQDDPNGADDVSVPPAVGVALRLDDRLRLLSQAGGEAVAQVREHSRS